MDPKDHEVVKEEEEAKLKCDICGMRFKKARHVKTHIDYFHSPRNFICEICDYRFATQRDRDRHRGSCGF